MTDNIINILNAEANQIKNIFDELDKNGKLKKIFPELIALKGVDTTKKTLHKDNYIHTIQVVENTYYATTNPWLRLVSILHDIGKAKTKKWIDDNGWTFHNHEFVSGDLLNKIFNRLNIPIEHYEYVKKLIINHGLPKSLTKNPTDSAFRRFGLDMGKDLEDMILFCKCDITTKNIEKKKFEFNAYDKVYNSILEVRRKDEAAKWRCVITGEIIMNYFSLSESKEVGIIKKILSFLIKSEKLENEYNIAFEYMKNIDMDLIKELINNSERFNYDAIANEYINTK